MNIKKQAAHLRAEIERRNHLQNKLKRLPDQFRQRYRAWALTESQAEFARGFGLVKLIANDELLLFLAYLNTLSSAEAQLEVVIALCKRAFSAGTLEPEAQRIVDKYLQFSTVPFLHSSGQLLSSVRVTSEQIALKNRFFNHRREKKAVTQGLMLSLKETGTQHLGNLILENTSALWFERQVGSGYIVTTLEFGGWFQLRYSHTIFAGPGAHPGTRIATGISPLTWMGIGESAFSWLIPDDIPNTVRSIFKLSEHFLSASGALLSGLDILGIDAD